MSLKSMLMILSILMVGTHAKVTTPEGPERPVNSEDFYFHPSSSKQYNENWSYQFVFDNGTHAFVNFNRAVIPTKGIKTGVDITFKNFNGKKAQVGREYPKERFVEDRANSTLSINSGKSSFYMKGLPKKGHQVHFETDKNGGYLLDMTFLSAVPGKVPGNGHWRLKGDEKADYFHFIHTPYAQVEGVIALGKDTLKVKGYAYMDHIMSTRMATETTHAAYMFSSPQAKIAGRIAEATKDYGRGNFGYAMIYRNDGFHVIQPTTLDITKKLVKSTWDSLDDFDFKATKGLGCYSPLDNINGSLARWAAKKMLGGKIILCPGIGSSEVGPVNFLKFHVDR